MARVVALGALLRRLFSRELSSISSVGLNNLFFCLLFLIFGSRTAHSAFWNTALFQLLLLAPLLMTFSLDTQDRFPRSRLISWPLTNKQRLMLSGVSFILSPLLLVIFLLFLCWMDPSVAICFLTLGVLVHLLVFVARKVCWKKKAIAKPPQSKANTWFVSVAQLTTLQLFATLDLSAAALISLLGVSYRIFAHSPQHEAFPVLALFTSIALSTAAQRLMTLDGGQSWLRYRLWPVKPWKIIVAQDSAYLLIVFLLVAPLNIRGGLACALMSLAVGRYPSIAGHVNQRRWRFTSGDPRFGIAQIVLGIGIGLCSEREGLSFVLAAIVMYVASVFFGQYLWKTSLIRAPR